MSTGRFDWEPRRPAEGWLQIQRTQKRDAQIQDLKQFTDNFKHYTSVAQWEGSSQQKAEVVRTIQSGGEANRESLQAQPHCRPSIAEVIKLEDQQRHEALSNAKSQASLRREALLSKARTIAAQKFNAQTPQHNQPDQQESDECGQNGRRIKSDELGSAWEKQVAEKKELQAKRCDDAALETNFIGSFGTDKGAAKEARDAFIEDLRRQIDDIDEKSTIEKAARAAEGQKFIAQWHEDLDAEKADEEARQTRIAKEVGARREWDAWWKEESAWRRAQDVAEDQQFLQRLRQLARNAQSQATLTNDTHEHHVNEAMEDNEHVDALKRKEEEADRKLLLEQRQRDEARDAELDRRATTSQRLKDDMIMTNRVMAEHREREKSRIFAERRAEDGSMRQGATERAAETAAAATAKMLSQQNIRAELQSQLVAKGVRERVGGKEVATIRHRYPGHEDHTI